MSWVIEGVKDGKSIGWLGVGDRGEHVLRNVQADAVQFTRQRDAQTMMGFLVQSKVLSASVAWREVEHKRENERLPMDVTIVVTCYNDHRFLPKCLQSCVEQGAREIVLVDDGSDSQLPADVWKLVKENGIIYVRHGVNRGLGAARNTAFGLATSTWVIPLDADDWFYKDAVWKLYEKAGDDCACIIGNLTEGSVELKPPMYAKADAKTGLCTLTKDEWAKQNMGFATTMIRRSAWNSTRYRDDRKTQYEDWHFNIRLWKSGHVWRYVPVKVYEHTVRPDGMLRVMHPNREKYQKEATEELFR